jgi:hypothetical protein
MLLKLYLPEIFEWCDYSDSRLLTHMVAPCTVSEKNSIFGDYPKQHGQAETTTGKVYVF